MKKFAKVVLCLLMCLSLGGCFNEVYTRSAQNNIVSCQDCLQVTNINSLIANIEKSMRKVSAVNIDYQLVNTKKTFKVSVDAITKDKRINWDLYASMNYDDTDVNFYLKDGKLYVIYPHNGANVIMKDKVENFVTEAETTLDLLNATYDKDNFSEFMLGDKLAGFNFEILKDKATYIKNEDGSYLVKYKDNSVSWEMDVTSNYLFKEIRSVADNFNSTLKFNYPSKVTIEYPMGLDFLTLNIEEVKEILKVDNFAEIIDEDLKSN